MLSDKAKALKTLYRIGRLDAEGLKDAADRGVITAQELRAITDSERTERDGTCRPQSS